MSEEKKKEKEQITGQKKEAHQNQKESKEISLDEEEYQELKKEAEEKKKVWEKYVRLYAEYENAKKLWQKQKEELLKFSNFRLLKELVSLYDEIKMAFASLVNIDTEHRKGIEMIEKRMQNILEKENVEPIEAKGKRFDPFQHEVMGFEERDDCEENVVLEVLQEGYVYEGKILRPAKVKVSRRPLREEGDSAQKEQEENKKEEIVTDKSQETDTSTD